MDRPYIQNPFPPPPRHVGKTVLFCSVALTALAGCGYLIWMLVAPETSATLSAPRPDAAAQSEIATMVAQLGIFQKSIGRYPTAAEGLDALVQRPSALPEEAKWPKLRSNIPRDPWGRAYEYQELPGIPPAYRVHSRGANPDDPSDDISQTLPAVSESSPQPATPRFR